MSGPVIMDSGGANISSLRFALARLGVQAPLTADPARLRAASHVFLPGVGAAAGAMERLRARGLAALIGELKQPVLGICLGMQLLFEHSEEDGGTEGLGLLAGRVRRIPDAASRPVPHMGWSRTRAAAGSALFEGLGEAAWFYYVHSYAAPTTADTVAHAEYGEVFSAAVNHGNVHGVQFHPERSGETGARLLANFLALPAGP